MQSRQWVQTMSWIRLTSLAYCIQTSSGVPMPRLHQVSRAEADAPIVTTMYDLLFPGRDPVAEPGTETGTRGDWWPAFANVPDILEHAVKGFGIYRSGRRVLDPVLRELGQARAGWAGESQFVFSQHCKALRALGVADDKIEAVGYWPAAVVLLRDRDTRARVHRLPGARQGPRARPALRCHAPAPGRPRDARADLHHRALPAARRDVAGVAHRVGRHRRAGRRGRGPNDAAPVGLRISLPDED